jgi:hypothetical protein
MIRAGGLRRVSLAEGRGSGYMNSHLGRATAAAGVLLLLNAACAALLAGGSPLPAKLESHRGAAARAPAAIAAFAPRAPRQGADARAESFAGLNEFTLYDATLLERKFSPTLAPMKSIVVLYEWGPHDSGLWSTGVKDDVPGAERFTRLLSRVKNGTPVVLDIERWFKDTGDEGVWRDTYTKLRETVVNFKAARPDLPVACFNAAPWGMRAALNGHEPDRAKFETQMRLLTAAGGLNEKVDFYAEGVYASKKLPVEDWEKWIEWRTGELRRLAKPVHLILNPYYSGTTEAVPPDYWDRQLALARRTASSVIVWTDYVPTFDRNAHWFRSLSRD